MNTNQTLEQMREMGLRGMSNSYKSQLELPIHHQLEGNELIAHLIESEKLNRSNERLGALLKIAKLRLNATPEMIEFEPGRNLNKGAFVSLLEGNYLDKGTNVHITGSAGCGKSFLACAMGHKSCMMGYKTKYYNMNRLIEAILLAKAGGTYIKLLNQIEKIHLLILDDFGLQSLNNVTRLALLQIIEDRHGKRPIIITSQLPVSAWHKYLGEETLADSIMDRLTGDSQRIELEGSSRRKKK